MELFLLVAGCLLFIEGIPYFLSPPTLKKVIRQILQLPDSTLRLLGFGLMFTGLLTVFVARHLGG